MKLSVQLLLVSALVFIGCSSSEGPELIETDIQYSELYSTDYDGSNLTQLTNAKNFIHYADFVPNSSKIYFVQTITGFDGSSEFYINQYILTYDFNTHVIDTIAQANIFDNTSSVYERLVDTQQQITASPDGRYLYYSNRSPNLGDNRKDIFSVDLATKQIANITNIGSEYIINQFSISFDGSMMVYTVYRPSDRMTLLYLYNFNEQNSKLITESSSYTFDYPQLLNDNKTIVFAELLKQGIFLVNIDSMQIKRYDSAAVSYYTPLSRDNNIIVLPLTLEPTPIILNLNTHQKTNLDVPTFSIPFFEKDGKSVLYFDTDWILKRESVDGTQNNVVFDYSNMKGSTHVPQSSYTKDKIIFIYKDKLKLHNGDIK